MQDTHYRRIETVIEYLVSSYEQQPSLQQLAELAHCSESHFHRIFTQWAGTTPKRFAQYLSKQHAKRHLERGESIEQTSLATGLSSSSRLHDLLVTCEAMSPGQYKSRGNGLNIELGVSASPFGPIAIAKTPRGICALDFLDQDFDIYWQQFQDRWCNANLTINHSMAKLYAQRIFPDGPGTHQSHIKLHLSGTNFQLKVWEGLLKIPAGRLTTYGELANQLNAPKSARAVGSAVAKNPIAYLIPCHRVIRQSGVLGQYRWGAKRKACMIGWELSHDDTTREDDSCSVSL